MDIPKKMKDIIKKYNDEINNKKFDVVYQDMYDAGGRTYVELFSELLHDAEIENIAPLYNIIDNKLYKRVD